jgi:hypothetical protein
MIEHDKRILINMGLEPTIENAKMVISKIIPKVDLLKEEVDMVYGTNRNYRHKLIWKKRKK